MHRIDAQLKLLDSEYEMCDMEEDRVAKYQISAREEVLKPDLFTSGQVCRPA
jgi:hypothetical protein